MDANEAYLFRKKSEYVVRMLKKRGMAGNALGNRSLPDIFENLLSFSEYETLEESFDHLRRSDRISRKKLRLELLCRIESRLKSLKYRRKSDYEKNLEAISELLDLSSCETSLLECFLINLIQEDFEDLTNNFGCMTLQKAITVWSVMTGVPANVIRKTLSTHSNFLSSGLVKLDKNSGGSNHLERIYDLSDSLVTAFTNPHRGKQTVWRHFFKPAPATKLDADCFAHLKDELERLEQLLKHAIERKQKGVNILFYGAAGAGKTELARLLARQTGLDLYEVAQADDDGEHAVARERNAFLSTSLRALQHTSRALLLFDESDEVLNGDNQFGFLSPFSHDVTSTAFKPWLNSLLENNVTPVLWIVNSSGRIDPAIQRRFSYSLSFKPPGRSTRIKMWEQVLRKKKALRQIHPLSLKTLAQDYEVTVGVMEKAVETAHLMSGNFRLTLEHLRTALDKAVELKAGGNPLKVPLTPRQEREGFDMSLLNTTPSHESLIRGLRHFTETPEKERLMPCVSVCLHGPPGTGKTAFARNLADKMDRPLLVKRASDLLSMYVGGTEANLAETFQEATEDECFLLIDEVDTFLLDRSGATRSWEVTQVNELLTQLEQFRGVFFATTNRMKSLDSAVLRRFSFKLEFGYLNLKQRVTAFRNYFTRLLQSYGGISAELSSALATLKHLTPGDFAVVRQACQFQIKPPTQESLVAHLEAEMRMKPVCARQSIGF